MSKIKQEVTLGSRGSIYPAIKKLSLRPDDNPHSSFQLPAHAEQNLSAAESAEIIADHFSKISGEFCALNAATLPQNIQSYLAMNDQTPAPMLSVAKVLARIRRAKKPNGLVPGDLPKKVLQKLSKPQLNHKTTLT